MAIHNFIGIDPGKTGSIAIIKPDSYEVHDMPLLTEKELDAVGIMRLLKTVNPNEAFCMIEKAQAFRGQGIVSTSNYLKGYGIILGMLRLSGIRFEEISPFAWKKCFSLIKHSKDASRIKATQLFPNAELGRKKDHGRAEALLIAEYGRRQP